MASLVKLPCNRVCEPGRAHQLHVRPLGIDQPTQWRKIPNLLGIGVLVGMIVAVYLKEVVADRASAFYVFGHLGLRRMQVGHDPHAGKADKGYAAVQYNPACGGILTQIELERVGPMAGMAAQPQEDDAVSNLRLQQQCRGNVCNGANGNYVGDLRQDWPRPFRSDRLWPRSQPVSFRLAATQLTPA